MISLVAMSERSVPARVEPTGPCIRGGCKPGNGPPIQKSGRRTPPRRATLDVIRRAFEKRALISSMRTEAVRASAFGVDQTDKPGATSKEKLSHAPMVQIAIPGRGITTVVKSAENIGRMHPSRVEVQQEVALNFVSFHGGLVRIECLRIAPDGNLSPPACC